MSLLLQQLANRLVAMVLEVGVIPQHLVSHVLGDLLVHTRHRLLLGIRHLVPVHLFLLLLQLLHPLSSLLARHRLSPRLTADPAEDVVFVFALLF